MRPLLEALDDGREHFFRDIVNQLQPEFQLSTGERAQQITMGRSRVYNRVEFAKKYLFEAGLLARHGRFISATPTGKKELQKPPKIFKKVFLMAFPCFRHYFAT